MKFYFIKNFSCLYNGKIWIVVSRVKIDHLVNFYVNLLLLFIFISALGAAALDNKLYVCGGYDGVSSLSSVECYDPNLDQWTMVSHMTRHRSASGVTVLNGQIYALGGHDGLSIFDSVNTIFSSVHTQSRLIQFMAQSNFRSRIVLCLYNPCTIIIPSLM